MEPMSVLIPRLWPFLSHSTSSVRRSTLQTLQTLTKNQTKIKTETTDDKSSVFGFSKNNDKCDIKLPAITGTITTATSTTNNLVLNFGVKDWPPMLLQEALRHIFQRVLVEHVPDIQQLVEHVWNNLVTSANLSALLHAACPYVACWLCLAMQPARLGFDPAHLINYKPIQNKVSFC
jgi:TATA-binding protein-associated factor